MNIIHVLFGSKLFVMAFVSVARSKRKGEKPPPHETHTLEHEFLRWDFNLAQIRR